MNSSKDDLRSRTFRAGVNAETGVVIIVPLIVAFALLVYGLRHNVLFPPGVDLFSRVLFVYTPFVLSALTVIVALFTLIDNLMIRITVTPEKIHFKQGKKEFECNWHVLAFAPPPPERKFMKSFAIGDGNILVRVNSAYFPKFDKVVKFIKAAKKQASESGYTL